MDWLISSRIFSTWPPFWGSQPSMDIDTWIIALCHQFLYGKHLHILLYSYVPSHICCWNVAWDEYLGFVETPLSFRNWYLLVSKPARADPKVEVKESTKNTSLSPPRDVHICKPADQRCHIQFCCRTSVCQLICNTTANTAFIPIYTNILRTYFPHTIIRVFFMDFIRPQRCKFKIIPCLFFATCFSFWVGQEIIAKTPFRSLPENSSYRTLPSVWVHSLSPRRFTTRT